MLTDIQVKSLKPKEKRYSMADGEGLSIEVFPTGKKKWVLSYRIEGKQTRKQLGEYPEVGCKEIRKVARDFKAEVSGCIKSKRNCGQRNTRNGHTLSAFLNAVFLTFKSLCNKAKLKYVIWWIYLKLILI